MVWDRCFLFSLFSLFSAFLFGQKKQEALQILNQLGDVASLRKQSLVAHVLAKSPQARMLRVFTTFSGHLSMLATATCCEGNFEGFPLGR